MKADSRFAPHPSAPFLSFWPLSIDSYGTDKLCRGHKQKGAKEEPSSVYLASAEAPVCTLDPLVWPLARIKVNSMARRPRPCWFGPSLGAAAAAVATTAPAAMQGTISLIDFATRELFLGTCVHVVRV